MKPHILMTTKLQRNVNDGSRSYQDITKTSNFGSRAEDEYCGLILNAPSQTMLLLHIDAIVVLCATIHSHFCRFTLKLCIFESIDFSNFI
jgi:formylmethanofuran dehydrogenase subunit E-like metal-binding protein